MVAQPNSLVVVDKPAGWTSHDVVARLRKLAATKKVGHAGTLDPMATGVLVCGIGGATRLLGRITLTDKQYRATIRLGYSTTTDDAAGEPVDVAPQSWVPGRLAADVAAVRRVLDDFTGQIWQRPSSVSAIKIDGKRAYARVRAGEDVVLPERQVSIDEIELVSVAVAQVEQPGGPQLAVVDVDVVVTCSTGTYVRSIARDVGQQLGTFGHLAALRRTRVGPFDLAAAHTLECLATSFREIPLDEVCRLLFATVELNQAETEAVRHGGRLPWPEALDKSESIALFDSANHAVALAECKRDLLAPVVVWAPAS